MTSTTTTSVPPQWVRGRSGRCWDADGREFVDLVLGYGPVILGHGHPAVVHAVAERTREGTLLPGRSPDQDRLRDAITELYPGVEDVLTFKTGSEAVAAALRLARARTGRDRVLRVGFHGWHDQVASPYLSCHEYVPGRVASELPPGITHEAFASRIEAWIDDRRPAGLLERIHAETDRLAAVIVDPVQLVPPFAETAQALVDATHAAGGLLIFDESKTGFRIDLGGFQGRYGVRGDLTVLSKAVANGLPLALVAGAAAIVPLAKRARIKGTYGAELSSIAAALATIDALVSEDGPARVERWGGALIDALNDVFASARLDDAIAAVPYRWTAMPFVVFSGEWADVLRDAFYDGMQQAGVLMLKHHMSFVCLEHDERDLEHVVQAAASVVANLGSVR